VRREGGMWACGQSADGDGTRKKVVRGSRMRHLSAYMA
jgi:hypothetical protein